MIIIHQGDCLTALQSIRKRHAWVTDPPANIGFMGRKWDKADPVREWRPAYAHPSADLRELQSEEAFVRYWGERFGAMNDLTEDDGVAIVWALPRTQHLTQTALRYAGWKVPFVFSHLHGQGWNKNGGHLKPGHESWLIAVKGAYELGIDACRIPRGEPIAGHRGAQSVNAYGKRAQLYQAGDNAKHRHTNGAHPIDVGLSHCEECERVGTRRVRASENKGCVSKARSAGVTSGSFSRDKPGHDYATHGTESVPAFCCLASCSCGRTWLELAGSLANRKCECGQRGQWACPVAEVDAQSGNRPGMSGGGKHRNGSKGGIFGAIDCENAYKDQGGASRYFHIFNTLHVKEPCHDATCSNKTRGDGCAKMDDGIGDGANPEAAKCCAKLRVDGCGNCTTDQSPPDTKSTTKTETLTITDSTTLSASRLQTTTLSTPESAKIINSSETSSIVDANDATNTSPSTCSRCEGLALTKGIVDGALPHISSNGSSTMLTTGERTEQRERPLVSLYEPTGPGFHYFAKAGGRTDEQGVPSGERHAGCENLYWRANKKNPFGFDRVTMEEWEKLPADQRARGNVHPTVKSLALMMHLVKLAGLEHAKGETFRVGDLCTGSGGTAIACQLLGAEFDGAEMCPEAVEIANARLAFWRGITPSALAEFVATGDFPVTSPPVDRRQLLLC
jgi:hypothetical protein